MKLFHWITDNILFVLTLFLLAFIPLYPKKPLLDVVNTWVYIRAEDFVVVFVLLVWFYMLVRRKITLKTPLTIPMIIFWIIGAIATIHGVLLIFPSLSGTHANVAFLSFLRRIEYLSVFFVAYAGIKDKRYVNYVVGIITITLLLVIAYGFGQKFLGFPAYLTMNEEFAKGIPIHLSALSRVPSTFAGHYDLAAYLVLVIPLLTSMIFGFKNRLVKAVLFGTVSLGFALLFMTVSRVSVFVLLFSLLMVLAFQKKKLVVIALCLMGFVSFVVLSFSPSLMQRFGNTVKEIDVLVDADTGEAIGHVKEVPTIYFKDKIIRKKFAESKSEIITPIDDKEATASGIVHYTEIPPSVPLVIESNAPTGENLPQGTGYINLTLSPVTKKVGQFFYQKASDKGEQEEIVSIYGDYIIKKALAYDLSFTTRFQGEWPNAIDAFKRNILFGSGYGSISLAIDNNYLRILGEVGILGFSAFFSIFIITGIYIKKVLPDIESPVVRNFILGSVAGIFGLGLNAILIDVFEASKIAFLLWLLIGVILGTLRLYQKNDIDIYKEFKKTITSSYAVIIYLFIATVVIFAPMTNNYFVGDDFTWFRWVADCNNSMSPSENCGSFEKATRFFTQSDGFFYRPGTKIYFLLMYSAFWLNQTAYHVASLLLHFTVAVFAFLLARKILKDFIFSVLVAFLFLIMSGYSEAVFWISSTGFLFNAVFALASLLLFIRWEEKKQNIYLVLSLFSIVFSLLFHEMGVVVPLMIILYKLTTDEKFSPRSIFEKKHYLLLFSPLLPYIMMRYVAHSHWFSGDYSYNLIKLPYNIVGNSIGYGALALLGPGSLSIYQQMRNGLREHLLMSMIATIIITCLLVMIYRRFIVRMVKPDRKIITFSILFSFVTLLPFLGLGNITSRYSYLASIGFILLFVFFVKNIYSYLESYGKSIALGVVTVVLCIFSFVHIIQLQKIHIDWYEAGEKSKRFFISIDEQYTDSWAKEHMQFYFVNVPIRLGDAWVFPVGLNDAIWLVFRNERIQVHQSATLEQALQEARGSSNKKVFEFNETGSVIERIPPVIAE